ncbi:helix-turn-helix transcriptional regulator [Vibrio hibernica]|uniref:helix-turn-helix transcriptional regulator n=1 Tax=Vibrio hibernica TaxID=2587465 RepID=UPI0039B056C5
MEIMLKDVLKAMREKKQLKQSEVAEYVGVTAQTYMKWENGKNEPKASDVKKLAEVLEISESEICRGATFSDDIDMINFMQKTASIKHEIDPITFTMTLYEHIQDKKSFLKALEAHRGPELSAEEMYERYKQEQEDALEDHLAKKEADEQAFLKHESIDFSQKED